MLSPIFYDASGADWYKRGPELASRLHTLTEEALKLAHDPSTSQQIAVAGYVLHSVLKDLLPYWPEQGLQRDYYLRLERHLFPAARDMAEAITKQADEGALREKAYALILAQERCSQTSQHPL